MRAEARSESAAELRGVWLMTAARSHLVRLILVPQSESMRRGQGRKTVSKKREAICPSDGGASMPTFIARAKDHHPNRAPLKPSGPCHRHIVNLQEVAVPVLPRCHSGGRTTPITGRQLGRASSRLWARARNRCAIARCAGSRRRPHHAQPTPHAP
jgi:hypothetical protein